MEEILWLFVTLVFMLPARDEASPLRIAGNRRDATGEQQSQSLKSACHSVEAA